MEHFNLWKTTGQSEEERNAEIIAKLEQTNPSLAGALKKGFAKVKQEKIVITPAMRAGAKENEAFHEHRLQGED